MSARAARCACPSPDARRCYCLRSAPDDSEPKDEVCECECHEPDEDEDDGFSDDYREYEARVISEVYGNNGYVDG